MSLIPDEVRAVYFDAVGTLIFPDPPVAEAYHAAGRRYGSRLTLGDVDYRFRQAFAAEERHDARVGNRTGREREYERWLGIVRATFPDVDPIQQKDLFGDLWNHFGVARHWRVAEEVPRLIAALRGRGLGVGLASNFDRRLVGIAGDMPGLDHPDIIVRYSEEVGWRKPAREFFAAVCDGYSPNQVLLVGDDRVNDYEGARAAGLHAILLDDTTTLTDLLS